MLLAAIPFNGSLLGLGFAVLIRHNLYLVEHEIAIVDRCHDLIARLYFLEDRRIVDFVVHCHSGHPALDFLAIHFQAVIVPSTASTLPWNV